MILINVISDQFGTPTMKHSLVSQHIPVINLGATNNNGQNDFSILFKN